MSARGARAVNIVVSGRVQRVGYRRYVLDVAQELGVSGFVQNLDDGRVQIFSQAPAEVLEQFVEKAKNPPPPAVVRQLDLREARARPGLKGFRIKYGKIQEELQEGFGAMQTIFLDYWREFRDYREEFRDFRQEFRDYRQEFRDYRQEFREFAARTDENFQRIMDRYGEISDKLTIILETLVRESKETREMIYEMMRLLRDAVEKISK